MRMRGGGAVDIGCAVIAAAGAAVDAGEDDDAVAADDADFASCEDDDDAAAGADDFALRADDRRRADDADFAAGADDFPARADDRGAAAAGDFALRLEDVDAATVVASPMASVSASLIASGDASFERLRLLERVPLVLAADFLASALGPELTGDAAGADAFCFLGMGVCVVAAGRRLEIAAGARCC
jgi:hypothetical protein